MEVKPIEQVLRDHTARLLEIPGVVGTGKGLHEGRPCILVLVAGPTPELERAIPDSIEGYSVRVQSTGEIRARGEGSEE